MDFVLDKKTGFFCKVKDLLILDSKNIPFYYRANETRNQKFNLPSGKYNSDNLLFKLDKPVFYTKPKLKKRYVFKRYPKNFKIIYGVNPNKCTVDLNTNTILFDNEYLNAPRFITDFIKFHELGHYRYSGKGQQSEKDCDSFAAWCMIEAGYNPTQIRVAIKYSLSDGHLGIKRKIENFNYLQSFKAL